MTIASYSISIIRSLFMSLLIDALLNASSHRNEALPMTPLMQKCLEQFDDLRERGLLLYDETEPEITDGEFPVRFLPFEVTSFSNYSDSIAPIPHRSIVFEETMARPRSQR